MGGVEFGQKSCSSEEKQKGPNFFLEGFKNQLYFKLERSLALFIGTKHWGLLERKCPGHFQNDFQSKILALVEETGDLFSLEKQRRCTFLSRVLKNISCPGDSEAKNTLVDWPA